MLHINSPWRKKTERKDRRESLSLSSSSESKWGMMSKSKNPSLSNWMPSIKTLWSKTSWFYTRHHSISKTVEKLSYHNGISSAVLLHVAKRTTNKKALNRRWLHIVIMHQSHYTEPYFRPHPSSGDWIMKRWEYFWLRYVICSSPRGLQLSTLKRVGEGSRRPRDALLRFFLNDWRVFSLFCTTGSFCFAIPPRGNFQSWHSRKKNESKERHRAGEREEQRSYHRF